MSENFNIKQDGRKRIYDRQRGEAGLQFLCSTGKNSISYATREIARACWRLGYEVSIELSDDAGGWAKTSIRHLVGRLREPYILVTWGRCIGLKNVHGNARIEWDVADSYHWADEAQVRCINGVVDLLVTPATSNLKDFSNSGIECDIDVVPLGVDRNVYKPWGKDNKIINEAEWVNGKPGKDTFIFLCAGMMQERKGLNEAIEGFIQAFDKDDDVAFLVKNVPHGWGKSQKKLFDELRENGAHGMKFGLIEKEFSDYQMARLLSSADCFVNTHMREGFGMMPLQAMSCGTVPLVTAYDGPMDYCNDDNAIMLKTVGEKKQYIPQRNVNVTWADIRSEDIADCMVEAKNGGCEKRKSGAMLTALSYTWEETARKFVASVEQHIGPVKKRMRGPYGIVNGNHKQNLLSVAFPVKNSAKDLDRALTSLKNSTWKSVEAIIFDDGSEEDIAKVANKHSKGDMLVTYNRSDAWVGEGCARDWMIKHAQGEYIFLTDADVEFTQLDWAERLVAGLENAGNKIVLHPTMLRPDGLVWSAGGCYRYYPQYGTIPAWHIGYKQSPEKHFSDKPLAYAPFVGWFGRTAEISEYYDWIGGYFPTIFIDVDMAFWLKSHGFEFWNLPDARVVHHANSYTRKQSGSDDEQGLRFTQHANDFIASWSERIEHEIETAAHFCSG